MSPDSSTAHVEYTRRPQDGSRRGSLANASLQHDGTTKQSRLPNALSEAARSGTDTSRKVHYTCFVRLPFNRHDFHDPPVVRWDTAKDKALWKLIYKNPSSKDLDWQAIADRFDVTLPFLLQQAAWLSERHLEGMRKQMQRLGGSAAVTPVSPMVDVHSGSSSGTSSNIQGSVKATRNSTQRPSSLTFRTDPTPSDETKETPATPTLGQPPLSRTPSTTTVTQSRVAATGSRVPIQRAFRGANTSSKRNELADDHLTSSADASISAEDTSSRDSESGEEVATAARDNFRRPAMPRHQDSTSFGTSKDEDDEDSPGGYLPFAASSRNSNKTDGAATLRSSSRKQTTPATTVVKGKAVSKEPPAESSESSSTSAQQTSASESAARHRRGPLSPQQRAQLASLSPRYRKEGSEGSPSMGSSFSDLESSVTQSALEEALMSMQQHGSPSTRMSSLGNVLKRMQ